MSNSNETLVTEIRRLIHLVAVLGTESKPQRVQIQILASAGFPPREIADLIGTTANTVRVFLATMRKKRKSRRRR